MKKIAMVVLLFLAVSLVSVCAETWQEYIQRAQTMTYNVQEGIKIGHWSTWSYDKWGALMATYDYLEQVYENIYLRAPGLSEYERNIYRDIYLRTAQQYKDMERLLGLAHGGNVNAINRITNRRSYWFDYLANREGIISFN